MDRLQRGKFVEEIGEVGIKCEDMDGKGRSMDVEREYIDEGYKKFY